MRLIDSIDGCKYFLYVKSLLIFDQCRKIRPVFYFVPPYIPDRFAEPVNFLKCHHGIEKDCKVCCARHICTALKPEETTLLERLLNFKVSWIVRLAIELFKQLYVHVEAESVSIHIMRPSQSSLLRPRKRHHSPYGQQ